jgi:hypothetical protein
MRTAAPGWALSPYTGRGERRGAESYAFRFHCSSPAEDGLSYWNVEGTAETRRSMVPVMMIGLSFAGCVDLPWSHARLDVACDRRDQLFT